LGMRMLMRLRLCMPGNMGVHIRMPGILSPGMNVFANHLKF